MFCILSVVISALFNLSPGVAMFALNQVSHIEEPWLQFKNLLVRQLAFCVCSPNILSHIRPKWYSSMLFNFMMMPYGVAISELSLQIALFRSASTRIRKLFTAAEKYTFGSAFWNAGLVLVARPRRYHPYQLIGHSIQKIARTQNSGWTRFSVIEIPKPKPLNTGKWL